MAYISLYRKYRPENFDRVIGQEHIVRTLTNQIRTGNIGHAYLFTGTRGTGKTSVAKIFARAVNCETSSEGSPCGTCKACRELSLSGSMDIMEIDAASNNGVDEIREIRDKVKYPPVSGRYKVYIVDEVHMLTPGAFNALLKTLEEPPAHAIFILATTEAHKLPQTILSRCMRFDFRLVSSARIGKLIEDIYKEQGKEYESAAVAAIASAGEGSVRDALSIADMCMSFRAGKLTYKDVLEVTGASSPELLISLSDAVLGGNNDKIFSIVEECASNGRNFQILSRDLSGVLRNYIYILSSDKAKEALELPEDVFNGEKAVAIKHSSSRILTALEELCKLESTLRYAAQPRIAFEAALVRAAISGNTLDKDALSRIKTLEEEITKLKSSPEIGIKVSSRTDSSKTETVAEITTKITKTKPSDNPAVNPVLEKAYNIPVSTPKASPVKIELEEHKTKAEPVNISFNGGELPLIDELPFSLNGEESEVYENQRGAGIKEDKDYSEPPLERVNEDISQEKNIESDSGPTNELPLLTLIDDEPAVFGEVKLVRSGAATAQKIMGKLLSSLRKKQLFHLHGIFGYNEVQVWIEDKKFYIRTNEEYAFKQLTEPENHKVILALLNENNDGSFDKLIILQPESGEDLLKSAEKVKDLFDAEIVKIKK